MIWILFSLSSLLFYCSARISFLGCKESFSFDLCQEVNVTEELIPGTIIDTFKFADDSQDVNSSFTIEFSNTNPGPVTYLSILARGFEIDLVVASRIDREDFILNGKNLNFDLSVNGSEAIVYSFNVTIIDINDNYPRFTNGSVKCTIKESDSQKKCSNVEVIDNDEIDSISLQVIYSTTESISDFSIIKTVNAASIMGYSISFDILINKRITFKSGPVIQLQILANDSAGHETYNNVYIHVIKGQNDPPIFLYVPYKVSINEELPIGTTVINVTAVGGDQTKKSLIKYGFKKGNALNLYFDVDPMNGVISIARRIDRESSDIANIFGLIQLTVIATETLSNVSHFSEAIVHIQINDINDLSAVFKDSWYKGYIYENSPANVTVVLEKDIIVEDQDSDMNGQYSLRVIENGRISDIFDIYPNIGRNRSILSLIVKDGNIIDFETTKGFNITIETRQMKPDNNNLVSSFANVVISVKDRNDNSPIFVNSTYTFYIAENSAHFSSVGKIKATDKDSKEFGRVTYTLDDPSNRFAINNTSGEIFVNVPADQNNSLLDRETDHRFVVNAFAHDGGGLVSTTKIVILLTDLNDNLPKFEFKYYHVWLEENSVKFIGNAMQFKAIDRDTDCRNSGIQYQIVNITTGPVQYYRHFTINATTGILSVVQSVDRELIPNGTLELVIRAFDKANPSFSDTSIVQITVLDVNDNAPVFSRTNYSVTISQNIPDDMEIISISATDDDEINTPASDIIYRLIGADSQRFIVEVINQGITKAIIKKNNKERLEVKAYSLILEASDRDFPRRTNTTAISIEVTEVNDEIPRFNQTLFRFSVQENLTSGSIFGQVFAKDPDLNCNLSFSIVKPSGKFWNSLETPAQPMGNLTNYIGIQSITGKLFILSPLDREKFVKISGNLQVIDIAAETQYPKQTSDSSFEIEILDVNDNQPKFQSSEMHFDLAEDSPFKSKLNSGATKYYVTATDADSNSKLTYRYIDKSDSFHVDPQTGQIFLLKKLDRETINNINFTVCCNDGWFESNLTVIIQVVDINDNKPVFTDNITMITIHKITPIGTIISNFSAMDKDEGENARITFNIKNVQNEFAINNDGALTIARSLVMDSVYMYSITLEIADNGEKTLRNSKEIEIKVLDNTNTQPIFNQSFYYLNLTENENIGKKIGEIAASDNNMGENGNISFSLLPIENNSYKNIFKLIKVEKIDGKAHIFVTSSLESSHGLYVIILRATDNGTPPLHADCVFIIKIDKSNHYSLNFTNRIISKQGISKFSIYENEIANITTITAYDGDKSIGGQITFRLDSDNLDHKYFSISHFSGNLVNIQKFDRETKDLYRFRVIPYFPGQNQNSFSANIEVLILDRDDNWPCFPNDIQTVVFNVQEGYQTFSHLRLLSLNGFKIGNVSLAFDRDLGSNAFIQYKLNKYENTLHIDPESGDLYGLDEFDREEKDSYIATIEALPKSGQEPHPKVPGYNCSKIQLVLNITDKNDNAPEFKNGNVKAGLPLTSPVGTRVIDISEYVTDKDLPSSNHFTFSMENTFSTSPNLAEIFKKLSTDNLFTLNSTTGILYLAAGGIFQINMTGYLRINISVSDGMYQARAQCTIYLLDPDQKLVIVFGESKSYQANLTKIAKDLDYSFSNISANDVKFFVDFSGQNSTELYIRAIHLPTNKFISSADLWTLISKNLQKLSPLTEKYHIKIRPVLSLPSTNVDSKNIYKLVLIVLSGSFFLVLLTIAVSITMSISRSQRQPKAYYTLSRESTTKIIPIKLSHASFSDNGVCSLSKPHLDINMHLHSGRRSPRKIGVPVYGNTISLDELFSNGEGYDKDELCEITESIL